MLARSALPRARALPRRNPHAAMRATHRLRAALMCGACAAGLPGLGVADTVRLAAAANFAAPLRALTPTFERTTGHTVKTASGSTGQLVAQIRNGAPFDVLLSADDQTAARLAADGLADATTRRRVATGRLVLWSPVPGRIDPEGKVLRDGTITRLAVANPRVAPYGAAALATLQVLGLQQHYESRLVTAENITQAWQFVASGNAQAGFVALSQVIHPTDGRITGSAWLVPASLHPPLSQEAILLRAGTGKPAALALLRFLQEPAARAILRAYGYAD